MVVGFAHSAKQRKSMEFGLVCFYGRDYYCWGVFVRIKKNKGLEMDIIVPVGMSYDFYVEHVLKGGKECI